MAPGCSPRAASGGPAPTAAGSAGRKWPRGPLHGPERSSHRTAKELPFPAGWAYTCARMTSGASDRDGEILSRGTTRRSVTLPLTLGFAAIGVIALVAGLVLMRTIDRSD